MSMLPYQSTSPTLLRGRILQQQQTECRLPCGISDNLVCPDYALPEIAYQAFLELRTILHAPDEVIMAAILAAMSASCQHRIRVKPPHMDKAHVTTLAIYVGAETGDGKSPALDRAIAAFRLTDLARAKKHKQGEKERNTDRLLCRAKRRTLLANVSKLYSRGTNVDPEELAQAEQGIRNLADIESSSTPPPQMVKGDISPAKLLDELDGDHVSLLMATPEGRNFFGKMTDADLEMHNLLWDGATVTHERRYHSVAAHNPLVTYCAMTHPDNLHRFIKRIGKQARASGWFGRGLLSRASPYGSYRPSAVLHPTFPRTDVFNARSLVLLEGCEELTTDSSFEPTTLEFDEEATMVFMEMLHTNNQRMESRDDWGPIRDFGRKHPSNVARIAAIFHYFSEQPGTRISKEILMHAIRIADWYVEQAKQILITEPMLHKVKKLVSFLHDRCYIHGKHVNYTERGEEHLIPLRWIMQFHNVEREELDALLDILVQENAIEYRNSYRGKRCIWLSPVLFDTL